MDGASAHLLLNHFPIIGSILSVLVLVGGFILRNGVVKKTALAMIVFTSVMTIPAFLTGEDAEQTLEAINKAPKTIIHEHEELGEKGLWTTLFVGIVAVFTFYNARKKIASKLYIVTLVILMANTIFMIKVGQAGGEIRHTEVRPGSVDDIESKEMEVGE